MILGAGAVGVGIGGKRQIGAVHPTLPVPGSVNIVKALVTMTTSLSFPASGRKFKLTVSPHRLPNKTQAGTPGGSWIIPPRLPKLSSRGKTQAGTRWGDRGCGSAVVAVQSVAVAVV